MCYGETDRLPELRERLKRLAPRDWTGSDADSNGLFVHPRALGGIMLGVSRDELRVDLVGLTGTRRFRVDAANRRCRRLYDF